GKESSMTTTPSSLHIGILGPEESKTCEYRGCSLWAPGYASTVTAAGANPVLLDARRPLCEDALDDLHGIVFAGSDGNAARQLAEAERLCEWCRERDLPLLAVDQGLLLLNLAHGGTIYQDLPRELPEAL